MRKLLALTVGASFLLIGGCTLGPSDDVGAATYNICCGAGCCCPSLGGGGAIGPGDLNPANSCEECDPSVSQTSWTPISGCGGTDSGPARTDAGGGDGGGGCSVGVSESSPVGAIALLGSLALFVRRRRT